MVYSANIFYSYLHKHTHNMHYGNTINNNWGSGNY